MGERGGLRRLISMSLSREDVDAVARRVVELLGETDSMNGGAGPGNGGVRFVDAATVARVLGVERDWVYAHARELGAIRLGGEKGRLRFDLEAILRRTARAVGLDLPESRGPVVRGRRDNGAPRKSGRSS